MTIWSFSLKLMDNFFKLLHKHMHSRPLTKSAGIILFLIGSWEAAEILSTNHEAKQNQQLFNFWAQLFEGRLALNLGLNLTRVSFSFVQSIFFNNFLCYSWEHPIINLLTERVKLKLLFKLSNLNSNFALTLGYLNPTFNNPALATNNFWRSREILVLWRYKQPRWIIYRFIFAFFVSTLWRTKSPTDCSFLDCILFRDFTSFSALGRWVVM